MILYWVTFITILGYVQPAGHVLDTPGGVQVQYEPPIDEPPILFIGVTL